MSEIFSAYVGPQQTLEPRLGGAVVVLPLGLVCLCTVVELLSHYAELAILAGGIVWALSVAGAILRPNRLALSAAILGAMLVGAGIVVTYSGGCRPLGSIQELLKPPSEQSGNHFSIIEC
ncbi:hypothetical protein [Hyalangium versicolor]|uniref:hypothetical protein n=1 Tax=Hyalangium versicolor TaxID=2861190 RepID=UPI001CCFE164|nr:hypothetical protein [Hyalangium versicolor]